MKATWTKLADYAGNGRRGQAAGLIAAAEVVKNAVKRGLAGGYTSGQFVTGIVLNSVVTGAITEGSGGLSVRIGSNAPYALYWELGHHNIFTRKYERVEIWVPAMLSSSDAAAAAYARAYARAMEGAE